MPSLNRTLPFLLYPALGLAAGWASVRWTGSGKDRDAKGPAAPSVSSSAAHREGRDRPAPPTTEQLLEIARQQVEVGRASISDSSDKPIGDWTDEELLTALESAVKSPEALLDSSSLASKLLAEYTKRDPDRALEWVMNLPPLLRQKFVGRVLAAWPPQRVDDALAIVKGNPEIFGRVVPMSLVWSAIINSAPGGPEAVLDRLRKLTDDGFNRLVTFPKNIPPGFDYAGLLGSPEFNALQLNYMRSSMIQLWAKEDREAAFQWLTKSGGLEAMFQLKPESWETTPEKSVELTRWMAGKMNELPMDQQLALAKESSNRLVQSDGDALTWIDSLKTPEVQDAFRSAAARGVFHENEDYVDRGLQALATLPDGERRLRALETLVQDKSGNNYRSNPKPSAEKLLRSRLTDWGAEPARIDAILLGIRKDDPTKIPVE